MAETIRTLSEALLRLPDNTNGQISPQDLRDAVISALGIYGTGLYRDGEYTDLSPLALATGVKTQITNDKAVAYEVEKPMDILTLVSNDTIVGREGDTLLVTVRFKIAPTLSASAWVDLSFEEASNVIDRQTFTLIKGVDAEHYISHTTQLKLDDVDTTMAFEVYLTASEDCEAYDFEWTVTRVHRARTYNG